MAPQGKTSIAPETFEDLPIPILGKKYPTYCMTDCLVKFPTLFLALFVFIPLVLTILSLNYESKLDTRPGTFTISDHSTATSKSTTDAAKSKWEETIDSYLANERIRRPTSERSRIETRFYISYEVDPVKARNYLNKYYPHFLTSTMTPQQIAAQLDLFSEANLEYMRLVEAELTSTRFDWQNFCWSARFRGGPEDDAINFAPYPTCTPPTSALAYFYPGGRRNATYPSGTTYWDFNLYGLIQTPVASVRDFFFKSSPNYRWFVDRSATPSHQIVTMLRSQFSIGVPLTGTRAYAPEASIFGFLYRVIDYLQNPPFHEYITINFGGEKIEQAMATTLAEGDTTKVLLCILVLLPVFYYYFHSMVLSFLSIVMLLIGYPAGFYIYMAAKSNSDDSSSTSSSSSSATGATEVKLSLLTALSYLITVVMAANGMMIFFDTFRQSGFMPTTGRRNLITVGQRVAYTYRRAGVGISVAAAVALICFLVNLSSKVPAVRDFCGLAAVFVVWNWLMLLTFFPAAMLFHHFHISRRRRNLQKQKEVLLQRGLRVRDQYFEKFNAEVEKLNLKHHHSNFGMMQKHAESCEIERKKHLTLDQPEGIHGWMRSVGVRDSDGIFGFLEAENFRSDNSVTSPSRSRHSHSRHHHHHSHPRHFNDNRLLENNNNNDLISAARNRFVAPSSANRSRFMENEESSAQRVKREKEEKENKQREKHAAHQKKKKMMKMHKKKNIDKTSSGESGEGNESEKSNDEHEEHHDEDEHEQASKNENENNDDTNKDQLATTTSNLLSSTNNNNNNDNENSTPLFTTSFVTQKYSEVSSPPVLFPQSNALELNNEQEFLDLFADAPGSPDDKKQQSQQQQIRSRPKVTAEKREEEMWNDVATSRDPHRCTIEDIIEFENINCDEMLGFDDAQLRKRLIELGHSNFADFTYPETQEVAPLVGIHAHYPNKVEKQRIHTMVGAALPMLYGKGRTLMAVNLGGLRVAQKSKKKSGERRKQDVLQEEENTQNQQQQNSSSNDRSNRYQASSASAAAAASSSSRRTTNNESNSDVEMEEKQQQEQEEQNSSTTTKTTGSMIMKRRKVPTENENSNNDSANEDEQQQQQPEENNSNHEPGSNDNEEEEKEEQHEEKKEKKPPVPPTRPPSTPPSFAAGKSKHQQQQQQLKESPIQAILTRANEWWTNRTTIQRDSCFGYFGKRIGESVPERQRRILATSIKHEGYTVAERFFHKDLSDCIHFFRFLLVAVLFALLIFSAVFISDMKFSSKAPAFLGIRPTERYDSQKSSFGESSETCDYCSPYFQSVTSFPKTSWTEEQVCSSIYGNYGIQRYFLQIDQCGHCGNNNSCLDCSGVASGPKTLDMCSQCIDSSSSLTPTQSSTSALYNKCGFCLISQAMNCSYCHTVKNVPSEELTGTNCQVYCNPLTTCSGHGSCNPFTGKCECFHDYENGFWKTSSSSSQDNYYTYIDPSSGDEETEKKQCSICYDGFFGTTCRFECAVPTTISTTTSSSSSSTTCNCQHIYATISGSSSVVNTSVVIGSRCLNCPWGYGGNTCQIKKPDLCDPDHTSNPDSDTQQCICNSGFSGQTCAGESNTCSGHGLIYTLADPAPYSGHSDLHGQCSCFGQWRGPNCDRCRCYNGGSCDDLGKCRCSAGWGGVDCQECASTCKSRGFCPDEPYTVEMYNFKTCSALFCSDAELNAGDVPSTPFCTLCHSVSNNTAKCSQTGGPVVYDATNRIYTSYTCTPLGPDVCVPSDNPNSPDCRVEVLPVISVNNDCKCRGNFHGDSCTSCNTTSANNARGVYCREGDGLLVGCDGNLPQYGSYTLLDSCGTCGGTSESVNECPGCDGIPGSEKVVDACGVCGGFNDCITSSGATGGTSSSSHIVKPQSTIVLAWGLIEHSPDVSASSSSSSLQVSLDPRFEFTTEVAQSVLDWVCDQLYEETELIRVSETRCFVRDWKNWLRAQGKAFPYLDTTDAAKLAFQYAQDNGRLGEIGFNSYNINATSLRVDWIMVNVRPKDLYDDDSQDKIEEQYQHWMTFQKNVNNVRSSSVGNMVISSSAFVALFSLRAAKLGTIFTAVLGCTLFGTFVLTTTCSLLLSICSFFVLVTNVLFVLACFHSAGFDIGPIEQVSLALLLGIICERLIHLCESYMEYLHRQHSHWFAQETTRLQAVRNMLQRVGLSLTTSTITLILACCIALSANLYVIRHIAVLVIIILASQLLFSLILMPAMLLVFGPVSAQRNKELMGMYFVVGVVFFLVVFLPPFLSGSIALI